SPGRGRPTAGRGRGGPGRSRRHGRQVDGPSPGRGGRRAGRQAHAGPAPVPDPRTGPAGPAMAGPEADRTRLPDRPLDGPPRRRVDPPPVRRGIASALPPGLPHAARLLTAATDPSPPPADRLGQ